MRVFELDSISAVTAEMHGQIVVSGSHGGSSAAHLALAHPPALAIFNDAGVGLDAAGVRGLAILEQHGVAACAVSHLSARIGEAASTRATGIVSHVNALATARGVAPGMACADALRAFAGGDSDDR